MNLISGIFRTLLFLVVFINMTSKCLIAQEKVINTRYKGKETELQDFLMQNLRYPVESAENKTIGYSITGITITPEGKILEISTINRLDESIEKDINRVLQMTKRKWLKCDTISTNQTFYIQIVYVISKYGETPVISNPKWDKYNFILPVRVTAMSWKSDYLPDPDDSIVSNIREKLEKKEFKLAANLVDESIRRNPFNKELYQLRISINRKLNRNDLVLKDVQKIQNFIPGVSLDELISKGI